MDWLEKINNNQIKAEISQSDSLMRKIMTLMSMTASEIKKNKNKELLKGVSIRISEKLYESGIFSESQHNRIFRIKSYNKKNSKNKKSCK